MKANFHTKAADTRGSSTGTMNRTQRKLRTRGEVASNSSTASSIATTMVADTVTNSQSSETRMEFRNRSSWNSSRKFANHMKCVSELLRSRSCSASTIA